MQQPINTICICGAGTMGMGIAQLCAMAGFYTILFDVNENTLLNSKNILVKNFENLVEKNKITASQKEECWQNLVFTTDINYCIADVIIEAIVEIKEAKINLLNQLAELNHSETIMASNTSSISINAIAQGVLNPSRVAGLHFFNPAPLMKLVEVIKGNNTNETVIETLNWLCEKLGKTAVLCNDSPGFIVNRVARHYYLQAMKMVQDETETVENIDALMKNCGFKMGPFELMDLIGLDVNYKVSEIVYNDLGKPERLMPSPLQKQKVDAGELGKKTGKGFYDY